MWMDTTAEGIKERLPNIDPSSLERISNQFILETVASLARKRDYVSALALLDSKVQLSEYEEVYSNRLKLGIAIGLTEKLQYNPAQNLLASIEKEDKERLSEKEKALWDIYSEIARVGTWASIYEKAIRRSSVDHDEIRNLNNLFKSLRKKAKSSLYIDEQHYKMFFDDGAPISMAVSRLIEYITSGHIAKPQRGGHV